LLTVFTTSYIHGGGWREPDIQSKSFQGIRDALLKEDARFLSHIAGIASVNYRLSGGDAADPARNARHPDHVLDVLAVLRFLNSNYGFGENYILVGHSAGATIAFQIAMGTWQRAMESDLPMPTAIVGIGGIYDIHQLLDTLSENEECRQEYQHMIEDAFGPGHDENSDPWYTASPVSGSYRHSWRNGKLVILAHSRQDELVEIGQSVKFQQVLASSLPDNALPLRFIELSGLHDDAWKCPANVVKIIVDAVETLAAVNLS
jgi:kynurenine formamidase